MEIIFLFIWANIQHIQFPAGTMKWHHGNGGGVQGDKRDKEQNGEEGEEQKKSEKQCIQES